MNENTKSPWISLLVLLILVAGQRMVNAQVVVGQCSISHFRQQIFHRPSSYNLVLELNPTLRTFEGHVDIKLEDEQWVDDVEIQQNIEANVYPWDQDPRSIILNIDELEVSDVKFHQGDFPPVVTGACHDQANKLLMVTLDKLILSNQRATLSFSFKGNVQEEAKGLFRSSVGSNHALVTHLKPAYARRLFPCFDEPRFKATFDLTILHPPGTAALSNMPIDEHHAPPDGLVMTRFKTTPIMSSHLLSLAVGEFTARKARKRIDGTKISIYAPEGTECSRHMLDEAVRVYDELRCSMRSIFMGLPQPLKKIDIVAVNMNRVAMEGWGLITMKRELLCEPLAKPEDRIYAVTALTNQIVRFWLGNLVTALEWNDLWITEGLANYLTTELTSKLHPEFNSELFTLINTTYSAMNDDDDPQKSNPIRYTRLMTADDIEQSYDSIRYKKSEAVSRMFANFLSKDTLNYAIRLLIQNSAYSSVALKDWQQVLSNCAQAYKPPFEDITGIQAMETMLFDWTSLPGYPIIFVSINNAGKLVVSQESNFGNDDLWSIPISFKLYFGPDCVSSDDYVLLNREETIDLEFDFEDARYWFKLNTDYQGYYRVYYQNELLWIALYRAFARGDLPPAEQLQLLSDSYSYCKESGSIDHFVILLKFLSKKEQTNDGVMLLLTRMANELHACGKLTSDLSEVFTKLMINYHNTNKGISGEAGSDVLNQYARGEVLDYLVNRVKKRRVIEEARNYMKEKGNWPPFLAHVFDRFRSRN